MSGLYKMGDDIIQIYLDNVGEYKKIPEKEIFIKCYKCVFAGSIMGSNKPEESLKNGV